MSGPPPVMVLRRELDCRGWDDEAKFWTRDAVRLEAGTPVDVEVRPDWMFERPVEPGMADWVLAPRVGPLAHRTVLYTAPAGDFSWARPLTEAEARQLGLPWRRVDLLTGLYARDAMADALVSRVQADRPFALLYIDADRMKAMNEVTGHAVGDRWLVEVSKAIRSIAPEPALAFRVGGEEFAVLRETADPQDALALAERLRVDLAALGVAATDRGGGPTTFHCRVTVGVASYPEDGRSPDELRLAVEDAVWAGKLRGGDTVATVAEALVKREARRLPRDPGDSLGPLSLS